MKRPNSLAILLSLVLATNQAEAQGIRTHGWNPAPSSGHFVIGPPWFGYPYGVGPGYGYYGGFGPGIGAYPVPYFAGYLGPTYGYGYTPPQLYLDYSGGFRPLTGNDVAAMRRGPIDVDSWDDVIGPREPDRRIEFEDSSPEAKIKSMRFEQQGDQRMKQLDYRIAAQRYQQAVDIAKDSASARFKFAIALAATGHYDRAAEQLEILYTVNPQWPTQAPRLVDILGADNLLAKTRLKTRIADYTSENVRDAERLFLMANFLYYDDDPARAKILMDTALLLDGAKSQYHVLMQAVRESLPEQLATKERDARPRDIILDSVDEDADERPSRRQPAEPSSSDRATLKLPPPADEYRQSRDTGAVETENGLIVPPLPESSN